jgi:hypothetical protein
MTSRAHRVLVHGLVYFGPIFAKFMSVEGWDFRYYPDRGLMNLSAMLREAAACDVIYQLGGRVTQGKFLRVAHALGKKRVVMHWLGSDTLDEQRHVQSGNTDSWVLNRLHHWAESDWMVREVRSLGVPCDLVPFPSALVPNAPSPLPETFRVLVYVPTLERADLYGLDRILCVARDLPEVSFELVGLTDGPISNIPPNIRIHGRLANIAAFYRSCSVMWRPVRHDGVSWMVLESLGHGRHVLWTYPFPGCIQVRETEDAREHILKLKSLHSQGLLQINHEGVRFASRCCYRPETLRADIHSRLVEILAS